MNRTDYKIYALIGIAFACIYALFPTKMHLSDGVGYAYMLEHFSDGHFMHPHHPLWLPLMQYLYDGAKLIIPDLRSMPFICFINALLGGLSVFVFIQIAHKLSRSRMISILTGLFFGFSWGMMNYSSDSNIYILALFIILLAARIILANDKPTPNDAIKASFLMVLASVIHQITFFFTFVVLVAILLKLPKRERFRYAAICTFFYSICVFAIFQWLYYLGILDVDLNTNFTFFSWLTSYGSNPNWWTIFKIGFIPANELFSYSQVNLFFHTIGYEIVRHTGYFEKPLSYLPYIIIYAIILLTIVYEIIDVFRTRKNASRHRSTRILLLVWILPYFIFNQFYCALDVHYKLFYLAPLLLLWMLRLFESPKLIKLPIGVLSCILLAFLAIWNISTGMVPNSKTESNDFLTRALAIGEAVDKNDLVIFSVREFYLASLTRYYTDADTVPYRMDFNRFAVVDKGFLKIDNMTVDFFNENYNRIFLSDHAYSSKPRNWYFSALFLPRSAPGLLALHPSSIEYIGEIKLDIGESLHEVKLKSAIRYRRDIN